MIILCLIFIFSTLALIYPYIIYPLILKFIPKKNIVRHENKAPSTVSLLFCCYNEEKSLAAKIENLRKLRALNPNIEILAYDDCSSDRSVEILKSNADLVTLIEGKERSGKASGMKKLASISSGEILVFTDANVLLNENAISNALKHFGNDEIGGICGKLEYLGEDETSTAKVGSLYWRLEEYVKDLESDTGSVMGADGSIFAIRREIYPDFPNTVLDDMTVSMSVVFAGKRLIKVKDVIAYENLVTKSSDEFARKVRIASRAYHTHTYMLPQLRGMTALNKFKYLSRKYIRWFGAIALFACALSLTATLWFVGKGIFALFILLSAAFFIIGRRSESGPISSIYEIMLAIIATLIGVLRAIRGQTVSTWNPAKSR